LPALHIQAVVQPVTRGILRLTLRVLADFLWQARFCWGYFSAAFWIWVEDGDNEHVYHSESFLLAK
ncbi:unnamed protein product, partial [Ascophyllum nodosum]